MAGGKNCVFCDLEKTKALLKTKHFHVIYDKFPVTPGHCLIITKKHRIDYFELKKTEAAELKKVLDRAKKHLLKQDKTISGFNIGINCGISAGQTVFHCHVHLIPRRPKDTKQPQGGVRGVIPGKQSYNRK